MHTSDKIKIIYVLDLTKANCFNVGFCTTIAGGMLLESTYK